VRVQRPFDKDARRQRTRVGITQHEISEPDGLLRRVEAEKVRLGFVRAPELDWQPYDGVNLIGFRKSLVA